MGIKIKPIAFSRSLCDFNQSSWLANVFEITGEGGSGKSVFAKLAELLKRGEGNTETGAKLKLDDELGRGRFVFKTLIICPEQSRYGGDGSGLKSISGGDKVSVRDFIAMLTRQ